MVHKYAYIFLIIRMEGTPSLTRPCTGRIGKILVVRIISEILAIICFFIILVISRRLVFIYHHTFKYGP